MAAARMIEEKQRHADVIDSPAIARRATSTSEISASPQPSPTASPLASPQGSPVASPAASPVASPNLAAVKRSVTLNPPKPAAARLAVPLLTGNSQGASRNSILLRGSDEKTKGNSFEDDGDFDLDDVDDDDLVTPRQSIRKVSLEGNYEGESSTTIKP